MKKAFFLDRDGVVIRQIAYLSDPEQVELYHGVPEAVAQLHALGYLVFVVTNQSGVARKMFTMDDVEAVHDKIQQLLAKNNQQLDGFYTCCHHPDFDGPCQCRKPLPGLIFQAAEEHRVDLSSSYMVGDKFSDLECGRAAGVRQSILVRTGYGEKYVDRAETSGFAVSDDLATAVKDLA